MIYIQKHKDICMISYNVCLDYLIIKIKCVEYSHC